MDDWNDLAGDARRLIENRSWLLSRHGDPDELPIVGTERITFNGLAPLAHETFEIRRAPTSLRKWQFCKTNGLPYDEVVTAMLIVFKLHLGDSIRLRSDGGWQTEWDPGRSLVVECLGINTDYLGIVEEDLRWLPEEGDFVTSFGHLLGLPKSTLNGIEAGLLAEAHRRLGINLLAVGFFLMPRDMSVTGGSEDASELTVDLQSQDDAFTHPARIAWREKQRGEIEAWWLELPETQLTAFLGRSEGGEGVAT